MKNTVQKGFTLIELMITVAIIGILAAVALPAYQDYTIRAQVSEAFSISGGVQTAVAEFYAQRGTWPADTSADLGITGASGTYVSSVTLANDDATGVDVVATFGNNSNSKISGGTVTLRAGDAGDGNVTWACSYDGTLVVKKYVPSSCI